MYDGLLQVFGHPALLGLAITGLFLAYTKVFGLNKEAVGVASVASILFLSAGGWIPEWIGYTTLILTALFLAMAAGGKF